MYGFIEIKHTLILKLIDHPYFQRLRRINQLGLASFVYPGATHTRFSHALGAYHLMNRSLRVLKNKGVDISEEEEIGALTAILLHDIGHGPLSHVLENTITGVPHEKISLGMMNILNREFEGALSCAIEIFENKYKRPFFNQLVSGHLDVDRMDYIGRDSFFSGVVEGRIGHERLIQMFDVVNEELVVEEKGVLSIEKFLRARKFMYQQVYLHKTVISCDVMVQFFMSEVKRQATQLKFSDLNYFLFQETRVVNKEFVDHFSELDDSTVIEFLKYFNTNNKNTWIGFVANSLLNRRLFKVVKSSPENERDLIAFVRQKYESVMDRFDEKVVIDKEAFLRDQDVETYSKSIPEIKVKTKENKVINFGSFNIFGSESVINSRLLCYPE